MQQEDTGITRSIKQAACGHLGGDGPGQITFDQTQQRLGHEDQHPVQRPQKAVVPFGHTFSHDEGGDARIPDGVADMKQESATGQQKIKAHIAQQRPSSGSRSPRLALGLAAGWGRPAGNHGGFQIKQEKDGEKRRGRPVGDKAQVIGEVGQKAA
ncbi:hypothetical protein D3C75_1036050 [compost metagenome]